MSATDMPRRNDSLSPARLSELKKGRKANIVIGPDGDRFIAFESASVTLLGHFSSYAQQKLINENGTVLYIPNGSKKAIHWIYKYMQAGERDSQDLESFETLTPEKLVLLYQHCIFLDYKSLVARIVSHLKRKYRESLPSAQEIKLFAASVPPLYAFSINRLVNEMLNPWTCDYTSYFELAEAVPAFGDALGDEMQKKLAYRIKKGKEHYQKKPLKCYDCGAMGHIARKCPSGVGSEKVVIKDSGTTKNTTTTLKCFKCGKAGHIARKCTAKSSVKASSMTIADVEVPRRARDTIVRNRGFRRAQLDREVSVVTVMGNGEGLRTCDREVKKGEMTRTGLIV